MCGSFVAVFLVMIFLSLSFLGEVGGFYFYF